MIQTTILTHADCDGICSGAIAFSVFPEARVFFTKPVSLLSDLKETNSEMIIICDIALTKKDAPEILKEMGKKNQILYFDHHIIPKSVHLSNFPENVQLFHDLKKSTSEIIFRHFQEELPPERIWLAIYGAIGDYMENTEFIQERIKNWDKNALYFEVSSLILGIKKNFAGYDAKRRIVKTLAKGMNPSDIPGLVKSANEAVSEEFRLYETIKKEAKTLGNIAYVKDIHTFGFRGSSALFAATAREKPVGISIHTRERYLDITMRTRDYKIKLNIIAERAAEASKGSGGGHPQAAGARIPLGSLDKFLKKANECLSNAIM